MSLRAATARIVSLRAATARIVSLRAATARIASLRAATARIVSLRAATRTLAARRSALYRGELLHARHDAAKRTFRYGVYVAAIDLDELPSLDREMRLFSVD